MKVLPEKCKKCLCCIEVCSVQAISIKNDTVAIDKSVCLECGCCAATCTNNAISSDE